MPKVQPIYDTRERACAPRESTPIQNERPRGAAGILGEEEQHMLRRPTRSPRLRTICRVVVYARRNPARMNRRIISEFGRIAPKCSLICGKERGGFPKQGGRFTSSHPCRCEGSSQGPREGSRAQGAPAPTRAAARNRQFPTQETTWPQGFPPWGRKGAPQQKEAQLCRESRVTRASHRRWGRASR